MGSCVSVHKDPESAMRFRLTVGTRATKAGAPNGHGFPAGEFDPKNSRVGAISGARSPGFGSKDEYFFDSQAYLESDCEDDFFSVNGDFTPSHGSSPNYQSGIPLKPRLDKATFAGFSDTTTEPSPRKKLAELLQEGLPGEPAGNDHNIMHGKAELNGKLEVKGTNKDQLPKSVNGAQYHSGENSLCSRERTPNDGYKSGTEKRGKTAQCCLPSLVHSLSLTERKKQTASTGPHNGE